MFYRTAPHFMVEAVQKFGPNVFGLQLETGEWRWYIVGCYLYPDNTSMTESFVATLKERPRGAELLVSGDFNTKMLETEGNRRGEDIAVELATDGLEDMLVLFLPLRRSCF